MNLPRVYPILDTQSLAARECSAETAATAWIEAGMRILQFRHKGPWTRIAFEQAERIAALCRANGVTFAVNDRADVAKLLDAGLHVGQDDLPPGDARRLLGPAAMLGYSTHNLRQFEAASAEPVDYLAIGPVFATASKQNPDPVVGLDELRKCRALSPRPLVAIGGITRDSVAAVLAAGADSVAIIGDLLPETCTHANLRRRMEEWQQRAQT
jgi:thiamine-phosphate pyrophosphorylase